MILLSSHRLKPGAQFVLVQHVANGHIPALLLQAHGVAQGNVEEIGAFQKLAGLGDHLVDVNVEVDRGRLQHQPLIVEIDGDRLAVGAFQVRADLVRRLDVAHVQAAQIDAGRHRFSRDFEARVDGEDGENGY